MPMQVSAPSDQYLCAFILCILLIIRLVLSISLAICADGLSGMNEAVNAAFPQTELQRCIVHQVRNTLKYMSDKNKKEFANDLKTIYHAPSEDAALEQLERVTEKWEGDYPNAMKSWYKKIGM